MFCCGIFNAVLRGIHHQSIFSISILLGDNFLLTSRYLILPGLLILTLCVRKTISILYLIIFVSVFRAISTIITYS